MEHGATIDLRTEVRRELAPRRRDFRRRLLNSVIRRMVLPRADGVRTRACVHELCIRELAERMRQARDRISSVSGGVERANWADEIRLEISRCLQDEVAYISRDERLAERLLIGGKDIAGRICDST